MILAEYIKYLQENFLTNRSDALEFASHVLGVPYDNIPARLSEEISIGSDTEEKLARIKKTANLSPILLIIKISTVQIFM